MALDMRRFALSRLNSKEKMAIANFDGIYTDENLDAFCKLMGIEDYWDIMLTWTNATGYQIRDRLRKEIEKDVKANSSVRGAVRKRGERPNRGLRVVKKATPRGGKGGGT